MRFGPLILTLCLGVSVLAGSGAVMADSAPTGSAPGQAVLVQRGPVTVTRADLEVELQKLPPEQRPGFFTSMERIRTLLSSLFVQKQLAYEAEQAGVDKEPQVQRQIENVREKVLADTWLNRIMANADMPDFTALAREQYLAEPDKYHQPEQVRVSHILIGTAERSEDEARVRANEVLALAKEGSKTFDVLAREFSDDTSVARNYGDLGYFSRGAMVKPFEEAAFAMTQPGELRLVQTQYGFHILRFEGRKEARQPDFEEVKDKLVQQLERQYRARIRSEELDRVRSLEGIQVNEQAIANLKVQADFQGHGEQQAGQ